MSDYMIRLYRDRPDSQYGVEKPTGLVSFAEGMSLLSQALLAHYKPHVVQSNDTPNRGCLLNHDGSTAGEIMVVPDPAGGFRVEDVTHAARP